MDSKNNTDKELFGYDEKKVDKIFNKKDWMRNSRFVKECKVSALAGMKMLKHALAGVAKGKATIGKPLEVMGLLIGKPVGNTIIVVDITPLPIEEQSTRASEVKCTQALVEMMEQVHASRQEDFIGWYCSHPFDVGANSGCFLSSAEVLQQATFQNTFGLWTAVVIDPLRSVAKQRPEIGVFRTLPQNCADSKVMPDGKAPSSADAAIVRWHGSWKRYYAVKHSFFMSSLASNFVKIMSRNSLWIRSLATQNVMDKDYRQAVPNRIEGSVKAIEKSGGRVGRRGRERKDKQDGESAYSTATRACCELAAEQCTGHANSIAKQLIFNLSSLSAETQ